MQQLIRDALKGHGADYAEVRIESAESTRLQYRGRELEEASRTTSKGGCARAFFKGGWGFVSFNDLSDLKDKVATAVRQAKLVGNEVSSLAEYEPAEAVTAAAIKKDPLAVSVTEKKRLFDEYNDLIWAMPKIQTSTIGYSDGRKTILFGNSEGALVEQSKVDVSMRISAMARADGDVQQSGISIGSNGDFSVVEGLHERVDGLAKQAVAFLSAPHAQGGPHTVVLDPVLAGVFVHEAFGHLSEADFVYENDRMREIMVLGKQFGGKHLNIVDGAAVPNLRGSYAFDEEGVPSTKTHLIKDGLLVGRLHSRETAAKMGERPTGNARAISYQFPPIVRMTNTYIEPQDVTFDAMIADIKDGIYAKNWYGGMTSMEMFTFSAGEAYRIRNGKVEDLVRPVVLSGNLFETLQKIDAIGNDLDLNQGGGCGKGGQSPLPVSNGSPHIRIQECLVGGK